MSGGLLAGAWWISEAASAALLLRLAAKDHLIRYYPQFGFLLAAGLIRSAALFLATPGPASRTYGQIWFATEPLLILLRAASAVEAYRHLSSRYAGMGWLGPAIPLAASGIAAVAVWASWGTPALGAAYAGLVSKARASWGVLAVAFGVSWWLLDRVPAPPSPAAVRHAALLLAYFSVQAAPFTVLYLGGPELAAPMGTVALAGATAVQVAWCFLIARPSPVVLQNPSEEASARRRAEQLLELVSGAVRRARR